MSKMAVVIDNGQCYSDYGIYGAVILNKKDIPLLEIGIEEITREYMKENHDYVKSGYKKSPPRSLKSRLIDLCKEKSWIFSSESISMYECV